MFAGSYACVCVRCSVSQHVAVCCSMSQCVAVCGRVSQHVTVFDSVCACVVMCCVCGLVECARSQVSDCEIVCMC